MKQRLVFPLIVMGLLMVTPVGPARATDQCVGDITNDPSNPVWILSQKVGRTNSTTITNVRGLSVDLTTDSPSMHETFLYSQAYSRQALRIQSGSSFIEFGWAYTRIFPQGGHQRRVYYINKVGSSGNSSPHYGGSIGSGKYIFQLYNLPSGSSSSYPNQFVMGTINLSNGSSATHWVFNPPYDYGTATTSITESDSCNEAAFRTANSFYYPNASPYYGVKVGDAGTRWLTNVNQNTHWGMKYVSSTFYPYGDWYTYCKYAKGCTQ